MSYNIYYTNTNGDYFTMNDQGFESLKSSPLFNSLPLVSVVLKATSNCPINPNTRAEVLGAYFMKMGMY